MQSTLDKFQLFYEELPPQKNNTITRKGGKGSKMSKNKEATPVAKKYSKTKGEHTKDIVIAMLVTAIVAFGAGVYYTNVPEIQIEVQDGLRAEVENYNAER